MEPINSRTTFETESIARKQVYYENKKDKANRCEMITCECGGKFQRKALTKHAGTKMHINFRLKREAEETIMHVNLKRTPSEEDTECWRQEIEDIKEQELRDNNAEAETWIAEDLQREKEKAEEGARLDAEPPDEEDETAVPRTKEEAEEDARLDAEYEAWAVEEEKRERIEHLESLMQAFDRETNYIMVSDKPLPPEKIEPAVIPEKKSCVVKIQVSKELKTREEQGGNFGRFRSASEVFEQPGFRNS